jgi:hypothetical protein
MKRPFPIAGDSHGLGRNTIHVCEHSREVFRSAARFETLSPSHPASQPTSLPPSPLPYSFPSPLLLPLSQPPAPVPARVPFKRLDGILLTSAAPHIIKAHSTLIFHFDWMPGVDKVVRGHGARYAHTHAGDGQCGSPV